MSLDRPPSLMSRSVHSWWSDRNPPGATINLHAAAKPLMRLMYHRQVISFIQKNQGLPLSDEIMDIYTSYLAFKYVGPSAKAAILKDLGVRSLSKKAAITVVSSQLIETELLGQLLNSPFTKIRELMCWLLSVLAEDPSAAVSLCTPTICELLVSLSSDDDASTSELATKLKRLSARYIDEDDERIVENARNALARIEQWPAGALVVEKARRDHCDRLLSHLRDSDPVVRRTALQALEATTRSSPEGGQTVISAGMLLLVPELLASSDPGVRALTCIVLANLGYSLVLTHDLSALFVPLLGDINDTVVESALHALEGMAYASQDLHPEPKRREIPNRSQRHHEKPAFDRLTYDSIGIPRHIDELAIRWQAELNSE
ncbi:armadillo-type protein [Mycena leptocephala]|nr:armadillo-type protein [Mycena leptocephala]